MDSLNTIQALGDLMSGPRVGILVGSDFDWQNIKQCAAALEEFGLAYSVDMLNAYRAPQSVVDYATSAEERGLKVILAASGDVPHLAGVVATHTTVPVVGIPVITANTVGSDSLPFTSQVPSDAPIAFIAGGANGPRNAGLFAVQILATGDVEMRVQLLQFKAKLEEKIEAENANFNANLS